MKINTNIPVFYSQGKADSIVINSGLDNHGIIHFLAGARYFSLLQSIYTGSRAHPSLLIQWIWRLFPQE
jgi:hypothetical protein